MNYVAAAVEREFPTKRIGAVSPMRSGNHKRTTLVTFADGETVVVQLVSDPESLRLEVRLARAVRKRTSLPVPRVLATGTVAGHGYAIVERAVGDELHERFVSLDTATQMQVARTFGRGLGQLHDAFSFDGYGALDTFGDDSIAEFYADGATDWRSWFATYARDGIDALPPTFDSLRQRLYDAVETASLPASPPAVLYPWDLRPGNALVADDAVSAVLDWGNPLAATPGLGVAKVEHLVADWYVADGSALRRAFREGYEGVRPYPTVERIYRVVAVVRSAVDSAGDVTRPGYPERTGSAAVAFHRVRLASLVNSPSESPPNPQIDTNY
ncbi:phosphotransferase [Haloferax mucosum ATCC BAA-1512]|uniref:Phosphotransferase n=1 Tax=Haloferax mucosum ATCC BAA-1512 TaxID=662479 RepID=M0ISM2_9EURY|nr:phosphotransferase [Haloferax mucosum]ELZ99002.1 phosphotransferase [Haloferax mucosum ATCC BAA-1512]